MADHARDDGGVNFCRPRVAGPAAAAFLAGVLLAGCGSGTAAGGPAAGGSGTGSVPGSAGPGSAPASPSHPVGASSPSVNKKGSPRSSAPGAAAGGSGSGPGCSRWPAGSTSTTLLLSPASNGRQYCVRPGQGVQVFLTGPLTPRDGAEAPRLAGTGLAPASGTAPLLRSPADAYQAVRAGRAVLTVVRMPCQSVPSSSAPAGDPDGTPGASSLGGPGAPARPSAVELAWTGGAPVGAQCALQQALRVTIVVA